MSTIEKLGAVPMNAATIVADVPFTQLQRFIVLNAISSDRASSFEDLAKRTDLFDTLLGDDKWEGPDGLASIGVKADDFGRIVHRKLSKEKIKHLIVLIKQVSTNVAGIHGMALLKLYERLNWMLTGDPEGESKSA